MLPFLIMALICAPLLYYVAVYRDKKRQEKWELRFPPYHPRSMNGVWATKIANIRYQCNKDDIGVVIFAVKPDEQNNYNRSSMAIIRDDGKPLGYIPKREASRFNRWSARQACSGVGMVQYDEQTNRLWADIFIFAPDTTDNQLEQQFSQYLQWVTTTYGPEYIPDRYR